MEFTDDLKNRARRAKYDMAAGHTMIEIAQVEALERIGDQLADVAANLEDIASRISHEPRRK